MAHRAAAKASLAPARAGKKAATLVSAVKLSALMRAYREEVPALLAALPADEARATPMQRAVWAAVKQLKGGSIESLDDSRTPEGDGVVAGGGLFAQAVGQALRRNPVAPAVPCHRCVRKDGSIGGFSGATDGPLIAKKVGLLKSEGVPVLCTGAGISIHGDAVL